MDTPATEVAAGCDIIIILLLLRPSWGLLVAVLNVRFCSSDKRVPPVVCSEKRIPPGIKQKQGIMG